MLSQILSDKTQGYAKYLDYPMIKTILYRNSTCEPKEGGHGKVNFIRREYLFL
jgi:hypothetical protein